MDFMRSIPTAASMAMVGLLIGCSNESRQSQTSEDSAQPKERVAVATDGAGEEVVLASATMSPAADAVSPTPVAADAEISLRDANAATRMIAQYFPIKDMKLKYCGVLSDLDHDFRVETDPPNSPERCWWVLAREEPEESRITIHLELLAAPRSEYDIPLQAGIDRVVFVHLIRCWDGDLESVPCEEFKIDGVEVVELFRRCDEDAIWHWEREEVELLAWQQIQERVRLQAAATADSEAPAATSSNELNVGVGTPANTNSTDDTDGLSAPVPLLRQLAFRRFIGRPLDEMVSELEMSGPCFGPGLIYGNMRGGNSFWASPLFPDHYLEVYYRYTNTVRFVGKITLHDRQNTDGGSAIPEN